MPWGSGAEKDPVSDLNLRVFARVEDPSAEFFEYVSRKENVESELECWVDLATPRNFEWSDEIREKTAEFGIADEEGEILATFPTLAEAEAQRAKAKVKFSLIFDDDDSPKAPKGAPLAKPASTVTEVLSTAR